MQFVKHALYGIGEVQETRFLGFEISARFPDGILRWIRQDELEFLPGSTTAPNARISGSVEPILPEEQFRAREIIEALDRADQRVAKQDGPRTPDNFRGVWGWKDTSPGLCLHICP